MIWQICRFHLILIRAIFFSGDTSSQGHTVIALNLLNNLIRQEITAIPHEMTRRVIDNFRERLRQCVDNNGFHLTDLIFKTEWNRMALYVLFENKNTFFVSLLYLSFIKPTNVSDHFAWL